MVSRSQRSKMPFFPTRTNSPVAGIVKEAGTSSYLPASSRL